MNWYVVLMMALFLTAFHFPPSQSKTESQQLAQSIEEQLDAQPLDIKKETTRLQNEIASRAKYDVRCKRNMLGFKAIPPGECYWALYAFGMALDNKLVPFNTMEPRISSVLIGERGEWKRINPFNGDYSITVPYNITPEKLARFINIQKESPAATAELSLGFSGQVKQELQKSYNILIEQADNIDQREFKNGLRNLTVAMMLISKSPLSIEAFRKSTIDVVEIGDSFEEPHKKNNLWHVKIDCRALPEKIFEHMVNASFATKK